MDDRTLEIDIRFRDEDPEATAAALGEAGAAEVKTVQQKGFTGIEFVVVGLLLSGGLANLVIRLLPLWQCGVVVDARGRRIETRKDCDLPRGSCLVLAPDGTRSTLHQPSQVELDALLGLGGSQR